MRSLPIQGDSPAHTAKTGDGDNRRATWPGPVSTPCTATTTIIKGKAETVPQNAVTAADGVSRSRTASCRTHVAISTPT